MFPILKRSLYGTAEKELSWSLEACDPQLFNELIEIRSLLPPKVRTTLAETGKNVYYYLAQLINPQTEGHIVKTDLVNGLAGLKCFSDFEGGDLVMKDVNLRVDFPSGSHCHLRGEKLHHFVVPFEGERSCLVLTGKENVRKATQDIKSLLSVKTAEIATLQVNDPTILSDYENALLGASADRDSLLDFIFEEEKARMKGARVAKKRDNTAVSAEPQEESSTKKTKKK